MSDFTINGDKHPIPIAVPFGDGIALHAANAALSREEALALAKWITDLMEENGPLEQGVADECAALAYDALSHANISTSAEAKTSRAAVGHGYAVLAAYYQRRESDRRFAEDAIKVASAMLDQLQATQKPKEGT